MEATFFGTSTGLPTKERDVQATALSLEPYSSFIWPFDIGEGTQHQILHHAIKLGKVTHIFITHMHGDHIFGLPGLPSSRSFQGGEQKPLTLVGPKGIKAYVEMSMNLSKLHLSYPITYIEIDDRLTYHHDGFTAEAHLLGHGIPSYGYRVMAPETTSTINVEALKNVGLEPGPKYRGIKSHDTFEHSGWVYQSKDFRDESKQGPTVAIFDGTKLCSNEHVISRDADMMVHEVTYIDDERHLANNYHHSHTENVFALIKEANTKHMLTTHSSNRCDTEDINEIYRTLIQNEDTPNFNFVKDSDSFKV